MLAKELMDKYKVETVRGKMVLRLLDKYSNQLVGYTHVEPHTNGEEWQIEYK